MLHVNGSPCYLTHHDIAYMTDAVAFSNAHFGAGTGSIYIDDVGCIGSEINLIDCPRNSTVYCRNGHSEDAGVRCQGLDRFKLQCYKRIV